MNGEKLLQPRSCGTLLAGVQLVSQQTPSVAESQHHDAQPRTPMSSLFRSHRSVSEVGVGALSSSKAGCVISPDTTGLTSQCLLSKPNGLGSSESFQVVANKEVLKNQTSDKEGQDPPECLDLTGDSLKPALDQDDDFLSDLNQDCFEEGEEEEQCDCDYDVLQEDNDVGSGQPAEPTKHTIDIECMVANAMTSFQIQLQNFMQGLKKSVLEAQVINAKSQEQGATAPKASLREAASEKASAEVSPCASVVQEPVVVKSNVHGGYQFQSPPKRQGPPTSPSPEGPAALTTAPSPQKKHSPRKPIRISTTSHKKEYNRLTRRIEAKDPQVGPEMKKLWNGSPKDLS